MTRVLVRVALAVVVALSACCGAPEDVPEQRAAQGVTEDEVPATPVPVPENDGVLGGPTEEPVPAPVLGEPLTEYMGRTIAQTMHWKGAEWLMRATREAEEASSEMLEALGLEPGMAVCDLGCGNGFHTLRMAETVGPEGRVFAADIQEPMLAMLARRKEARDLDNIELVLSGPADPKLPPASCDVVLMVDVYHELSYPVEILAALAKALKPGGRIVLVEFRGEDPTVPIKLLHKMTAAQVDREMEANGFERVGSYDELPWQHMLSYSLR